jgi:hypothetical protein
MKIPHSFKLSLKTIELMHEAKDLAGITMTRIVEDGVKEHATKLIKKYKKTEKEDQPIDTAI